MAKSRKPAITGLARPQGIIDDVVYPIASRVLRSSAVKKATKGHSRRLAAKAESRQVSSYSRKSDKYMDKSAAKGEPKRLEKKWRMATAKESAIEDYAELYWGSKHSAKERNRRVRRYAKLERKAVKRDYKR